MINITRGNDFRLKATFTRGGEPYKFDSVSSVKFGGLAAKYEQEFEYSDGTLTIKGTHELPAAVYGVEVIGKEGTSVRRTAFPRVVAITETTSRGTYDSDKEVDDYDIGMKVVLDLTVEKAADTSSDTDTKQDSGTSTDSSSDGSSDSGASSDADTKQDSSADGSSDTKQDSGTSSDTGASSDSSQAGGSDTGTTSEGGSSSDTGSDTGKE